MNKIKVVKPNTTTGKEQRYQPVTKPIDPVAKVVRNWITEYKANKLQQEIAAYKFWNIQ